MKAVWPWIVLLLLGAGWGVTFPLTKVAVSTGYGHYGLVFWQLALGAVFLGGICALRGQPIHLGRREIAMGIVIAIIGTIFPNTASYQAAVELPAGVMAILVATVSIFAYPVAMMLGVDRFDLRRLFGLTLGLGAVVVLSWPQLMEGDTVLGGGSLGFILLGLVAPLFYAFEGNIVGKYGTFRMDAIQTLFVASCIGTLLMIPVVVISGHYIVPQWPVPKEQWAMFGVAIVHATVYSGYVWFVGRVGAVFAAQVAYAVTLFGVFASAWFLAEAYPSTMWAALGLMIAGMALVQPRKAR